jgi:hypothetical protein
MNWPWNSIAYRARIQTAIWIFGRSGNCPDAQVKEKVFRVEHGGKRRRVYVTFVTDLEGIAMSEVKTPPLCPLNCPSLICLGFWQLSRQWRDFFSSLVCR